MTYQEAIELINRKQSLIGTRNSQGFNIGALIVVPANETEREKFFSSYIFTHNAENAIRPYIESDLEVWAIDTEYLLKANVIFYEKLSI